MRLCAFWDYAYVFCIVAGEWLEFRRSPSGQPECRCGVLIQGRNLPVRISWPELSASGGVGGGAFLGRYLPDRWQKKLLRWHFPDTGRRSCLLGIYHRQ